MLLVLMMVGGVGGVGIRSAQAQTKEFLQWYQNIKRRIETASKQAAEGAEVMQFPAELLRTLTPTERQSDNNNLLGRIQVIYQMKFTFSSDAEVQRSWYDSVKRWATYTRPTIYEQRMALDGNTSIEVFEATKRRGKEPAEFLVFIRNEQKGMVCDIVGYITLQDVITILSPELRSAKSISPMHLEE